MLQRTNLHCYFTKPYVPAGTLEAVATGVSNARCEATTTINSPMIAQLTVLVIKKGFDRAYETNFNSNLERKGFLLIITKNHSTKNGKVHNNAKRKDKVKDWPRINH